MIESASRAPDWPGLRHAGHSRPLALFLAAVVWTCFSTTVAVAETLVIQTRGGPLDDPRVATAIARGTDWAGLGGRVGVEIDRIVLRLPDRDEEIEGFDPQIARALLAESGYPDGLAFAVYFQARHEKLAVAAFGRLARFGLDATLRRVDQPREFGGSPHERLPIVAIYTEHGGPPPEAELPDLIVSRFDARYALERSVKIDVVVSNIGPGGSVGAVLIVREANGRLGSVEIPVPPLPPRDSSEMIALEIAVPDDLAGATLEMVAFVVQDDQVAEANRRNNAAGPIIVRVPRREPPRPAHDYAIARFSGDYDEAAHAVNLRLTVVNKGGDTAPRASVALIEAHPFLAPQPRWIGPLSEREATAVEWRLDLPEDLRGTTLDFTAEIDPAADSPERRANNRSETIRIAVPSAPPPASTAAHLEITRFIAEPAGDDGADFEITLRNGGDTQSRDVRLFVSIVGTNTFEEFSVSPLAPEEWRTVRGEVSIDGAPGSTVFLIAETQPVRGDRAGHVARAEARLRLPVAPEGNGVGGGIWMWVLGGTGLVLLLSLLGVGPKVGRLRGERTKHLRLPSVALVPAQTAPFSEAAWPPGARRIAFSIALVPHPGEPHWSVTRED